MTVRVKICGINDPAALDAAVAAGADWVGFNFFPPSPRYLTPAHAAGLSARMPRDMPGGPARVGLFVDPEPEGIATTLDAVPLDALQVYGVVDLPALRRRFGLPVWRAIGIGSSDDLPSASLGADRLVLEAKPPAQATRPGGNALRFDWSLLLGWQAPAPWILAGGLTVTNVAEAIRATGAEAVDVSSGVERSRGVKDPALIQAFIHNARGSEIWLRRATSEDADALARVHVQAWREAYAGQIPDAVLSGLDVAKRATMWRAAMARTVQMQLAILDGEIVGFGASRAQPDPSLPFAGEISAIYVLRKAQRRGLGRVLMAAMARDLVEQGLPSASLWVLETNTSAQQFYQALGGREVTRREQQRDGFSSVGVAYGWDDLTALL
jgi:phosphoribosylanthranilate isomerase